MLRIFQNKCSAGAKTYYAQADYYSEGQELIGQWGGKAAELLGLQGTVQKEQFEALCDNLHPQTGEPLTLRTRQDRTVLYDCNYNCPKSVGIIYELTGDGRVFEAFQRAVDESMRLLEQDARTRVRKRGEMRERASPNLVWATFYHRTSRPVKGEPDMSLHAHATVFNCTYDSVERSWKAVQFREIKRDARFYEAVFHSSLARQLRQLGYGITRNAKGWEISGVSPATIRKFSRRTALIEELARDKGITDLRAKEQLGAKTREAKSKALTPEELRAVWTARLSPEETEAIRNVAAKAALGIVSPPSVSPGHAISHAIDHCFERESVVTKRSILGTALRFGIADVVLNDVEQEVSRSPLIVRERDGREMATTRAVLAEEKRILDFARDGRGTRKPLNPDWTIQRTWLNPGQQKAVRGILSSADRVVVLRGRAGTGKTSLMQEAVAGIEAAGKQVVAIAPSTEASRGVLRREGFATADTVAMFLADRRLQALAKDNVLWVDESGLTGTKSMAQIFDVAETLNCRVVLAGDVFQHKSVERGSPLRLLETDAGLQALDVTAIERQQRKEYREAIALLAHGRTLSGFDALDRLGWVEELPEGQREQRVAEEYLRSVKAQEDVLVVCPTHAEGDRVTDAIRNRLRDAGRLGTEEREFVQLQPKHLTEAERGDPANYEPGDVIVFTQNAPRHKRGERIAYSAALTSELPKLASRMQVYRQATIALAAGDRIRITHGGLTADGHRLNTGAVYDVAGFSGDGKVVLDNGWQLSTDWGHLARAFVSTSHASQGKSVSRVLICQSELSAGATSQSQFYVSASRGRQSCHVICGSKQSLRDMIQRSEEALSATDLVRPSRKVISPKLARTGFLQRLASYTRAVAEQWIRPQIDLTRSYAHVR